MTDPLPEIKARRAAISPTPWSWDLLADGRVLDEDGAGVASIAAVAGDEPDGEFIAHAPTDIDTLIGEVDRLVGLLGRLEQEWADEVASCPVCAHDGTGHDPDCWLVAELARNANDPPEGEQP
jgi:hypothetical protein